MSAYFNQQSSRLSFRKLGHEDIPKWKPFFENNDRLKYLGIDISKSPDELATEWIERQLERYETSGLGHLAITLKGTREFIGVGGIIPRTIENNPEFEIAYSLLPQYWGNGFATELAQTMKNFGFDQLGLSRMISLIAIGNSSSVQVAKRNGMQFEKRRKFLGMEVEVYSSETKDHNKRKEIQPKSIH